LDNLTHTLIGVLMGDAAVRSASTTQECLPTNTRRALFIWVMAIGSNLPDADILYSLVSGNKLDYLSQHRGYTHTLIGALVAALLILLACEFWLRHKRLVPSRADRIWLIALAAIGPLLHLAMDATNSYGVHPFWPFHNGWLYGDAVFIIEPLFWAAAAPLVFTLRTRLAQSLVALALAGGIVLSAGTGLVPPALCGVLIALTIVMLAIGRMLAPRRALLAGVVVWLAATGVFIVASEHAAQRVDDYASERFPQATLLDRTLTPMPVNPLCWEVILAQSESENYVLRRAMLSLAPRLLPAAQCPGRNLDQQITAPLTKVADRGAADWQWHGELVMSRDRLKQLASRYCEAAVFLQFARDPWVVQRAQHWLLGDLRYDREAELAFAELELPDGKPCPRAPPWIPPRADLLR
jgi:inner membrane protein